MKFRGRIEMVVRLKRPIKKSKQTRARYRDKHVEGNNQAFIEKALR